MLFLNSWANPHFSDTCWTRVIINEETGQVIKKSFKNKAKKNTKDYNNKNNNKSNNKIKKNNNSSNDLEYYNSFSNFVKTNNFDNTNILMSKLKNGLIIK